MKVLLKNRSGVYDNQGNTYIRKYLTVKKRCDNNTLTIDLDGRIDTQNAGQIENDLLSAAEEARNMDLVLDADKLEYISSAGLPCAIAYDTVRCGNQYGIVFELLNAVTVGKVVDQNPDRIPDLGKSMGQLLKQLHTTPMENSVLPRMTEKAGAWIDYLEEKYLNHEDADLMRFVLEAVPERNTVLHLDFHEGNVMLQGEELILIDLDDICTGNPLFDLAGLYVGHVLGPQAAPDSVRFSMGMDVKTAFEMYRTTMETYLGTTDLASYEQTMQLLSMFYMLLYLAKGKDSKNLTPERAQGMIAQILPRFRQMAPMIRELVKKV